jgi:transposase
MEDGSPFSVNILALAIYLRFSHAISYRRLTQLFLHLYALQISEGALDAMLQRAKPCFDNEVAAILARLRRSRIVCSDETSVRIDGRTHWNWVFQNDQVVIHVVRNSRAASVVTGTMAGHRPSIWVSDLYGAQQGHADLWQVCAPVARLQVRHRGGRYDFRPTHEGAAAACRCAGTAAQASGREHAAPYQSRLARELNATMVLAPTNSHGRRLRKRYGKVRGHLFTFLEHPDVPPDNNGSERELRPTATYRKVTGGFRSKWGADLFAGVRSVVGTAARRGKDAYQAILTVLDGESVIQPG